MTPERETAAVIAYRLNEISRDVKEIREDLNRLLLWKAAIEAIDDHDSGGRDWVKITLGILACAGAVATAVAQVLGT
jgi:hypothetical protein